MPLLLLLPFFIELLFFFTFSPIKPKRVVVCSFLLSPCAMYSFFYAVSSSRLVLFEARCDASSKGREGAKAVWTSLLRSLVLHSPYRTSWTATAWLLSCSLSTTAFVIPADELSLNSSTYLCARPSSRPPLTALAVTRVRRVSPLPSSTTTSDYLVSSSTTLLRASADSTSDINHLQCSTVRPLNSRSAAPPTSQLTSRRMSGSQLSHLHLASEPCRPSSLEIHTIP